MYTAAELALLRTMDPKALPGVDTQVGDLIATTKSLRSLPTSSTAGVWYNATENAVWVTKAGAVLDGYDFGNATILVDANNVTIKNSTFEAGGKEIFAVQLLSGVSGATIENNTFNGEASAANPGSLNAFISANYANITGLQILGNKFLNAPCDDIDVTSGTISGNYFSGAGFSSNSGHPDAITIIGGSPASTVISNNFIDETWASGATSSKNGETNSAINFGGGLSNVTITNNALLGGQYTIGAGNLTPGSNVNIEGNYVGFAHFGAYSRLSQPGITATNNTVFDFTNPIYSTTAWTAYQARGISTTHLVIASVAGANLFGASSGSTTLYGAGISGALFGTKNVTTFVGGAGANILVGGSGPNVFKYLSFADSTTTSSDGINNFNPSKDVIDLSSIDANPAIPGVQNLTFIGGASFSNAGAQVRVVQNVSGNQTDVYATMAGSANPVFEVRLAGLLNLTAANFALTAAQTNLVQRDSTVYDSRGTPIGSTALLANGTENLFGAATSQTGAGGLELASAQNNNGSGTLSLLANNLTLSSGSAALHLTSGAITSTLTAHPTETIQATGQTGENFVYTSSFGSSDVVGFQASGANDQIQLKASMFSGLTAGQSAADWAHLLSSSAAVQSGADVTINDAPGDVLRLSSVSLASLTANAGNVFKFV
jgi:serralysin